MTDEIYQVTASQIQNLG